MLTDLQTGDRPFPAGGDFPALELAGAYAALLRGGRGDACHEQGVPYPTGFHWTERHLQCVWFDSRYRPAQFRLPSGERVTVLQPGEWNLEAGPDFLNARLQIDPGARQLRGDVEIHVRPSDWESHRHATDPAYARVIAHVTWFPGALPAGLPIGAVPLSLCEPVLSRPGFSLDDIDLKAYPHAILPETPRPCEALLKEDPDKAKRLLTAAGQYRLRAKALRIAQRLQQTGDRYQVFYEEVMAALGYKHNQGAFRQLAKGVPFAALTPLTREDALARLLGHAALLPDPSAAPDAEGQQTLRSLWDRWWRLSGEEADPPEPITWVMGGIRPQNAPVRRIAAAAALFTGTPTLLETLDAITHEAGLRWRSQAADCFMARCRWPFWNNRLLFTSEPNQGFHDLLGETRTAAILTNTVLPMALAEGRWPESQIIRRLPSEDISAPMRLTAWHLFGRDHNPSLYADNGLLQQGLIQIHLDFCLNAQPDCAGCRLLESLRRG
ncbi:MAG: DUF2851 family protein [Kiritimatiellae bacterium]|nr:DUF2851 family protein [Kiritimatiellia bacterium]